MNKNKEIERLRGIAVMMVVITHGLFLHLFPVFMQRSFGGVDIFFAISGFVVTLSLLKLLPTHVEGDDISKRVHRSLKSIKIFYIRRVFRILPLAVIWLFIYLGLSIIFSNSSLSVSLFGKPYDVIKEIFGFFSGTYNYLVTYGLSTNISHYWSLSVEEQFYLLLPLLLVLFMTLQKRIIAIGSILITLLMVIPLTTGIFPQFKILALIFAQRYFTLLFGVLLAFFFVKTPNKTQKNDDSFINHQFNSINTHLLILMKIISLVIKPMIVFLMILVIWTLPGIASDPFVYNAGYVLMGLFSAGLVFLASREEGWVFEIPFLRKFLEFVGGRSYFIYLSHFAFIKLSDFIFKDMKINIFGKYNGGTVGLTLQSMITLFTMLIIAEIFYRFIEVPLINLGKKYIKYKYDINIGSIQVGTFP